MAREAVEDMLLRDEMFFCMALHAGLCGLAYFFVSENAAKGFGYVALCQWAGFIAGVALEGGRCSDVTKNAVLITSIAVLVRLSLSCAEYMGFNLSAAMVVGISYLTFYSFYLTAYKGMEAVRNGLAQNI